MSESNENQPVVEDETALDVELSESIAKIKAGEAVVPQAPAETGESAPTGAQGPTGTDAPTGATGSTGADASTSQPTGPDGDDEFRIPKQGKWETDDAYEKRVELFDLVKRRRAATTPETKAALSAEITKAKSDLRTLGGTERFTKTKGDDSPDGATGATAEEDPTIAADKERLRALGGATKEDLAEIIRQERFEQEVKSDVQKFVDSAPELKDPDVREVFFDFVEANYAWEGKSGKALTAILGMAHETMFRPSESIQDRVLKGADVAGKVGSMQFPGGTGSQTTLSPDRKQSLDELKAAGMSEEKAMELISD